MEWWPGIVALFALLFVTTGVRVAKPEERLAVWTLGHFVGFKGPGFVLYIPILQFVSRLTRGAEGIVQTNEYAEFSGWPVPFIADTHLPPGTRVRLARFETDRVRVQEIDG